MATVRVTTDIELDIATAAKWFASLDDDAMCRFLVKVAEEARQYPSDPDNQWFYLGGHLRNCECSNDETRHMVRRWAFWMDNSNHGEDGR